jgi:hypothetical protein
MAKGYKKGIAQMFPSNVQPATQRIQLTITLDQATGATSVSGPIQDKLFCYGLLELARQVIQQYEAPKIQVPGLVLPADIVKH